MLQKLKEKYFNYLNGFRYELGLIKINHDTDLLDPQIIDNVVWVKGYPKTSWFADPFIYKVTDTEIHILAEEWIYSLGRGVISLVVVNKANYLYLRHKELLRLDTHLSWPFIIRKEGKTYVIPENSASGQSRRYIYDDKQEKLIFDQVIAKAPFIDPVFFEENGSLRCLMLLSQDPDIEENSHLYGAIDSKSEYQALNKVLKFNYGLSRAAGDFFKVQGKIYKPQQVGGKNYGEGVAIFEWNREDSFKEVHRIYPKDKRHCYGVHSFNSHDGYLVLDGEGSRYYYRRKVLLFLSKLLPFLPNPIRKK